MTLRIKNTSGFSCEQLPMVTRDGANIFRVVVKASFTWSGTAGLALLPEQPPAVMADVHWDTDPVSAQSVRVESDVSLDKPMTDLIVTGSARAHGGAAVRHMNVTLSYAGRALKRLRVFGDRVWDRGITGWLLSDPLPFVAMPVTYSRAYGGRDDQSGEGRNPIGTGYVTRLDSSFAGRRAPNVESVHEPISAPTDRPAPCGIGVVGRASQPRIAYAGTYDDQWLEHRFPLLPEDFDDRFNQTVDRAQWVPRPHGGEEIRIEGMSERGTISIVLPPCTLMVGLHFRDRSEEKPMDLDSVFVDTDNEALTLTWRTNADVHGDPFQLLETVIDAASVGRTAPARCC